jgi:hypothetical protein
VCPLFPGNLYICTCRRSVAPRENGGAFDHYIRSTGGFAAHGEGVLVNYPAQNEDDGDCADFCFDGWLGGFVGRFAGRDQAL